MTANPAEVPQGGDGQVRERGPGIGRHLGRTRAWRGFHCPRGSCRPRPLLSPPTPARGARALTCARVRRAPPRCHRCRARTPARGRPPVRGKCLRPPAAPEARRRQAPRPLLRPPLPRREPGHVLRGRVLGPAGRLAGIRAATEPAEAWRTLSFRFPETSSGTCSLGAVLCQTRKVPLIHF